MAPSSFKPALSESELARRELQAEQEFEFNNAMPFEHQDDSINQVLMGISQKKPATSAQKQEESAESQLVANSSKESSSNQ